jgi:hypothetical protein
MNMQDGFAEALEPAVPGHASWHPDISVISGIVT